MRKLVHLFLVVCALIAPPLRASLLVYNSFDTQSDTNIISWLQSTGAFNTNGSAVQSTNIVYDSFYITNLNYSPTGNGLFTDITPSNFIPMTSQLFTYERGKPVVSGAVSPDNTFYIATPPASGNFPEDLIITADFFTDAPQISFWIKGDGQPYFFEVNGVTLAYTTPIDGQIYTPKIVFSSAMSRRVKLSTSGHFGGVYINNTNTLWSAAQKSKRWYVVGDSITDGNYAFPYFGFAYQLQNYFTNVDWWVNGQGACGYAASIAGRTNLPNYLANDILTNNPNGIVYAMGVNDGNSAHIPVYSQTYSNALNCYTNAQAKVPGIIQVVLGPWNYGTPVPDYITEANSAIQAAVATASLTGPVYYINTLWPNPLITGTWNIPGSGNAPDFFIDSSPHPNNAGHAYYASWLSQRLKELLPDLDAPFYSPPNTNFTAYGISDPTNIPGLFYRFDATQFDGQANGTLIVDWTNSIAGVGEDFVQTSAAQQPYLTNRPGVNNNHSYLVFGPSSGFMTNKTFTSHPQPFTVVMVTSFTGVDGNNALFYDSEDLTARNLFSWNAPYPGLYFGNYAGIAALQNPINLPASIYAMVQTTTGNAGFVYTNSVPVLVITPNAGSQAQKGFTLSARQTLDGGGHNGGLQISAFYYWTNTALTTIQIQQVGNYLKSVYGDGVYSFSYLNATNTQRAPIPNFRYFGNAVNSPTNGTTLRFTNGLYYWAQ